MMYDVCKVEEMGINIEQDKKGLGLEGRSICLIYLTPWRS
jgi:hypothetical protein